MIKDCRLYLKVILKNIKKF